MSNAQAILDEHTHEQYQDDIFSPVRVIIYSLLFSPILSPILSSAHY